MGEKSADTAASVKKLSTATQMSNKDVQEWSYVFQKTGSSTEALQNSVTKLGLAMAKGDEGSKKISQAFKDLGISTEDNQGKMKKSSDLFDESITKLAGMKDITERNREAQLLFGGSYTDLLPILNKGADGIDKLKKRAGELGLVMSDDQVSGGAKYKKSMAELKEEFASITTRIGNDMLPYFGKFADWINKNEPKIKEFIDTALKKIGDMFAFISKNGTGLSIVLGIVLTAIIALNAMKTVNEVMAAWNGITKIATGLQWLWNAALSANPISIVIIAIVALIATGIILYNKCAWFRNFINTMWDGIKSLFTGVIVPYFQAAIGIFSGVFESIGSSIEKVFGNVKNIFNSVVDFVKNVFTGNWKGAWDDVINIFSNIFSAVSTIWKTPINAMIAGLNTFFDGLGKIKIPDWVPGIGGKGINIPKIPQFAIGTRYLPQDMLIQAHEGEMIVPKSENPYVNSGGAVLPMGNGITLTITNFYNNRKEDIEELMKEIEIYRKKVANATGGA